MPSVICLRFDWHEARRAFSRARAKTGNKIAASKAITAITTSSSISVKPPVRLARDDEVWNFMLLSPKMNLSCHPSPASSFAGDRRRTGANFWRFNRLQSSAPEWWRSRCWCSPARWNRERFCSLSARPTSSLWHVRPRKGCWRFRDGAPWRCWCCRCLEIAGRHPRPQ